MNLGNRWYLYPMVCAVFMSAVFSPAHAQTQNYFGSSGTITSSAWSTDAAGPYTFAFDTTGGGVMNFGNTVSSITGGNITVAGINATSSVSGWTGAGVISNFGGGSMTIDVSSGATLNFGLVQSFGSSNSAVAVGSSLVKNGDGVVGLAGGYYTGGFTLNAGTVVANNATSFGSNIIGGGTSPGNLIINGGTIAADTNRVFAGKFSTILANANFQIGAQTNHVSIAATNASLSFDSPMNIGASGNRTITIGGNGTYSFLGGIVGSAGLTINAADAAGYSNTKVSGLIVIAPPAIPYSGTTTISSGRVLFTSSTAIGGSGTNVTVGAGATFAVTGLTTTNMNRIVNKTGSYVIALGADSANPLIFTSFTNASLGAVGNFLYTGTITPAGSTYRLGGGGGALTVGFGTLITDANLVGANSVLITSNGSTGTSTVTFGSPQSYTGTTTIANGGIYLAPTVANLAFIPGTGGAFPGIGQNVLLNSGGTLAANGAGVDALAQSHLGRISTSSTGVVALGSNSSNTLNFSISGANLSNVSLGAIGSFTYSGVLSPADSTFRLGGGGGALTVTTVLAGAGNSLVISTNGTAETSSVTLPVANSHAGGTTINSGTLIIGNGNALGSGAFTLSGGNVVNSAAAITVANNVIATASTVTNVISNNSTTNTLTLTGTITGSGTILSAPVPGNNSALLINGNINGFTGTFRLSGSNAVNNMIFNHDTNVNNWDGSQATFVADGAGHQFRWGGPTGNTIMKMGALSGTGTGVVVMPVNSTGASTATLQVGALNTNTSLAGSIADNTNVSLAVTKLGTGSLNLLAASAYSGNTTITTGKLLANNTTGSATGTGNVIVGSSGTLGGNGFVVPGAGKTVTVSGTLAPGNSVGTLTLGSATTTTSVQSTGKYQFELSSVGLANPGGNGGSTPTATHDQIVIHGSLNITAMTVDISSIGSTGFNPANDYSWTIATASGGITRAFGQPVIGTLSGTDFGSLNPAAFSLTADTNNLYLNYSAAAVPEPATILLAGASLLGGIWYRRRSSRSAVS